MWVGCLGSVLLGSLGLCVVLCCSLLLFVIVLGVLGCFEFWFDLICVGGF